MQSILTCPECGRSFDLLDAAAADEWTSGHDCEVTPHEPAWLADAPFPIEEMVGTAVIL